MRLGRVVKRVLPRPAHVCLRFAGAAILCLAWAGCSHLPEDGPDYYIVRKQATVAHVKDDDDPVFQYALVDVTQDVLRSIPKFNPNEFARVFGIRHSRAPEYRVSVGDSILVTIYEAASSGLFAPVEPNSRPGNVLTLPIQMVDSSGNIMVPFAGEVRAAGLTLQQIRKNIESKLAERALEPQVVVSLPEQGSATVTIVGEAIGGANTMKLKPAAERIAEIIGRTGGIKYPAYETFISLERKGKMATATFSSIITNPSENIYVEPGDIIYAWHYQPKFSVFGAVNSAQQTQGLTGEFTFGSEGITLEHALAKTGGLADNQANANTVFLYRIEDRKVLEAMCVDLSQFPLDATKIPTIYRVNLRDPTGFFVMRLFAMRDRDVIYIANARAVEVNKFLKYAQLYFDTSAIIATDMEVTKINIRNLGN